MLTLEEFNSWFKEQKLTYASRAGRNKKNRVFFNVYLTGIIEVMVKNEKHELVEKCIYSEQNANKAIEYFNDL